MSFDEQLAGRVREALQAESGIVEKKMFGGIAFLLNGNMCCGVRGRAVLVRLDADRAGRALFEPHVSAFAITGKPMKGWVLVEADGVVSRASLRKWLRLGLDFAASLPPK